MPTGDAYSSGHLVPSPWDLHMLYLLRPILFRTCRYFSGLCSSNIPRYFLDFALWCMSNLVLSPVFKIHKLLSSSQSMRCLLGRSLWLQPKSALWQLKSPTYIEFWGNLLDIWSNYCNDSIMLLLFLGGLYMLKIFILQKHLVSIFIPCLSNSLDSKFKFNSWYVNLLSMNKTKPFVEKKEKDLTRSYDKSPYTHRKIEKATWQHKQRHQNFDDTIEDSLRTVSWSNSSHPTAVVKPVNGCPTFQQTATVV